MPSDVLIATAEELSRLLRERGRGITTVESCTGGLVGATITAVSGSSEIYPGGFITYCNELKHTMVGVSLETLRMHGAVSSQTAIEMARGGQAQVRTNYAMAITGIAGPGGGSEEKPVGTVWICVVGPDALIDCRRFVFPGDRQQIRHHAALSALRMAILMITQHPKSLDHELERIEG